MKTPAQRLKLLNSTLHLLRRKPHRNPHGCSCQGIQYHMETWNRYLYTEAFLTCMDTAADAFQSPRLYLVSIDLTAAFHAEK